jgi:hypothetical protein
VGPYWLTPVALAEDPPELVAEIDPVFTKLLDELPVILTPVLPEISPLFTTDFEAVPVTVKPVPEPPRMVPLFTTPV